MLLPTRSSRWLTHEITRPRFSYFEPNDNLGLCVIQDIIHFKFENNAFSSNRLQDPQDIMLVSIN